MSFGPLYCQHCAKPYWVEVRRRLAFSRFCSRLCRARGTNTPEVIAKKIRRGPQHGRFVPVGTRRQWRGVPGVVVKTDQGWQREHRVVAGAKCGEIVHHRDHDPTNNHPVNLMVMTQSEHAKLHSQMVAQQLNSSLVVAIA